MTGLSEKVAAEHQASLGFDDEIRCSCVNWTATFGIDDFEAHLIEATERTVRNAIAQQLEALEHDREAINHSARHGFGTEWAEGHDHAIRKASRIAREGTTP